MHLVCCAEMSLELSPARAVGKHQYLEEGVYMLQFYVFSPSRTNWVCQYDLDRMFTCSNKKKRKANQDPCKSQL